MLDGLTEDRTGQLLKQMLGGSMRGFLEQVVATTPALRGKLPTVEEFFACGIRAPVHLLQVKGRLALLQSLGMQMEGVVYLTSALGKVTDCDSVVEGLLSCTELPVGRAVVANGLSAKPELNGSTGIVMWHGTGAAGDRLNVDFGEGLGGVFALRAANLKLLQ
eukprot:Hpha_TRINITY_DN16822_c0_g11::TRINITY_DN16822_c0_g11_i1::g.149783::m.149783